MNGFAFAPEDIIAAGGFIAVVFVALVFQTFRSAIASSPRSRMRQRVIDSVAEVAPAVVQTLDEDMAELARKHSKKRLGAESALVQFLTRAHEQLEHMTGGAGLRWVLLVAGVVAAAGVAAALWADQSIWLAMASIPVTAPLAGVLTYRFLIARYRAQFLNGFPEALDLIIRAVRAGVPVVQAIVTAGKELQPPVGREFRIMGDALRLGMDAQDVMEAASKRIGVPDFQFFVVCLQLQRETGGPLADTVENLSNIIRARREVRLKTRALTAQGRAASKIIAMVPFVVMGALKLVGADYLDILFDTERGQRVLWIALTLIVLGLGIISHMTKLED
ncbi:MAG TPA: type II secretion system F family protein [Magnetospirillum sp.]|nr:type II secretion system F family protein [Magnetospirillum sp.]